MRKVAVFIACTLDGRIAGPGEDISWLFNDQDYGYEAFYDDVQAVVMGRKTYEVSISRGDYPYSEVQSVVFSDSKAGKSDEHVTFTRGSVVDAVKKLREVPNKNGLIWVVGGSRVINDCLAAGIVDELRLFVHPLVLGAGTPLFRPGQRLELVFSSAKSFDTGVVELRYLKK